MNSEDEDEIEGTSYPLERSSRNPMSYMRHSSFTTLSSSDDSDDEMQESFPLERSSRSTQYYLDPSSQRSTSSNLETPQSYPLVRSSYNEQYYLDPSASTYSPPSSYLLSTSSLAKKSNTRNSSNIQENTVFDFFKILSEDQKVTIRNQYQTLHGSENGLEVYRNILSTSDLYKGYTKGSLKALNSNFKNVILSCVDVKYGRDDRFRKLDDCDVMRIVELGSTGFIGTFRIFPVSCKDGPPKVLASIAFLKFRNKVGFYVIEGSTSKTSTIIRGNQLIDIKGPIRLENGDSMILNDEIVKFSYQPR